MPDLSMCSTSSTCPLSRICSRAPESGTKPSERQSWTAFAWHETEGVGACCAYYEPPHIPCEEVTP